MLRHPSLLLWLATLVVWLPWLGNQPLRDWDEGIVASVAHATMSQTGLDRLIAIQWTNAYLNKPPGLHWLIGYITTTFTTQEWGIRLGPALISSLAIPLLVELRTELDHKDKQPSGRCRSRTVASIAGVVLMTLLPMARHGRLAMLDGSLVSCSLLLFYGQLLGRRMAVGGLLAGLGSSGILLLKPPAIMGFLAIAIAWQWWQRQRVSRHFVWGVCMGLIPGITWHLWHFHERGSAAFVMWGSQGLARVTTTIEGNDGAWITPLLQIIQGGWPWLLFLPMGVAWAWKHRHQDSGRFELILLTGTALMVLPLKTQLPWYSHLLWPAIALLCAESLYELIDQGRQRWAGRSLFGLGSLLLIAMGLSALIWNTPVELPWGSITMAGLALCLGGWQLNSSARKIRSRGFFLLAAGWSLALLLFWQSETWLWELNETWEPRPLAQQILTLPTDAIVMHEGPDHPALEWYAGRQISRYQESIRDPFKPTYIITDQERSGCNLAQEHQQKGWSLLICPRASSTPGNLKNQQ